MIYDPVGHHTSSYVPTLMPFSLDGTAGAPALLASMFSLGSSCPRDQSVNDCAMFHEILQSFLTTQHAAWATEDDARALTDRTASLVLRWLPEYGCALVRAEPALGCFASTTKKLFVVGLDQWNFRMHW